jgi:hypothetical protein
MPWKTLIAYVFVLSIAALPATANVQPYPSSFSVQEIRANGATIHVRVGGTGPAVVLLHGFGDTVLSVMTLAIWSLSHLPSGIRSALQSLS